MRPSKVSAGNQPSVGSDRHQPANERAPADGRGRREPRRKTGLLCPERENQEREKMGDEADLCEEAKRHAGRQGDESQIAP